VQKKGALGHYKKTFFHHLKNERFFAFFEKPQKIPVLINENGASMKL